MKFDQERETRKEILPVVLKEDDPNTPYMTMVSGNIHYRVNKNTKEECWA